MKIILKYIIVFTILILTYNVLMLLGSLFPSSWIEKNVQESAETLVEEGNLYDFGNEFYVTNNNYTDALMINEAYSIDHKTPVYSYLTVRKNYKEGQTIKELPDKNGEGVTINNGEMCKDENYDTVGELKEFLEGKTEISINYARYWHGYLPVLRTSLLFFNISEIRTLLFIIFTILLGWSFYLISKKIGVCEGAIFVFALIIEGYFFVSYSLEGAPVFILMMLACIIILKRIEKIKNFYLYTFIIASITNFVDYLTVPLITLAMPLYLYLFYLQKHKEEKNIKYYFVIIIKSTLSWGIGYGATWLSKWLIYDLLYDKELIYSAIYQVIFRSVGNISNTKNHILVVLLSLTVENICYIFVYLTIMSGIFIYKNITLSNSNQNKKEKTSIKRNIPILAIALLPYIWYILLSNHTIIHVRFTYRNMIIFLYGILIFINDVWRITSEKIEKRINEVINKI